MYRTYRTQSTAICRSSKKQVKTRFENEIDPRRKAALEKETARIQHEEAVLRSMGLDPSELPAFLANQLLISCGVKKNGAQKS